MTAALLTPAFLAFALWGMSTGAIQDETFDFSCATFPADLRETDLIGRFGAENVTRAPVTGTDDGPVPGTLLFPNGSEWVEITWRDLENRRQPEWIRVRARDWETSGVRGRWRTPQGIGIGDDLKSLERRNGWPFRLRGFALEGGQGRLQSWGRGRLQDVDTGDCDFTISFSPQHPWDRRLGRLSHGEFSSGHQAMQATNPWVSAVWINYRNR